MDEALDQQPLKPRISAIVASYNAAPALRRTLRALDQSQQREKLEILVVDNGSRDESPQMDSEFDNVTVLRLSRHFGLAKSMNIAMRSAQADYLLFVEPGVEVPPDLVPKLASRLDADSEAVAVCPLLVDPEGRPVSVIRALPTLESLKYPLPELDPELTAEAVLVPVADWGAMMARKFFIRGLNYFDQRFGHHFLDVELGFQIRRAAKKTLLLPKLKAVRRPVELSFSLDDDARAALDADRALAAATFAGKHFGMLAGLKFRAGLIFGAIGRFLRALATFRDTGYEFNRMSALLSGQKIDGSQRAL